MKSYESIESLLQFTLCDIMDRVNIVSIFVSDNCGVSFYLRFLPRQLTTAFDGAIEITKSNQLNLNVQSKLEPSEVDVMKDLLILNRQHEIYVRKLLSNLKSVKLETENHVQSYGEKLLRLHDIVQYRSAVPSVQIFPKFKELTEEWMTLHNLSYVFSQQSQINNYLQHLAELCRQHQFDGIVHKLLGDNQVETDHTRLQKRRSLKLNSTGFASNISIVQPPESNSEVKAVKAIKTSLQLLLLHNFRFLLESIDSTQLNSTLSRRLNTSAFALTCWRRAEFYCPACQKWEQFCGIRRFMAFTASKLPSTSHRSLKSELRFMHQFVSRFKDFSSSCLVLKV